MESSVCDVDTLDWLRQSLRQRHVGARCTSAQSDSFDAWRRHHTTRYFVLFRYQTGETWSGLGWISPFWVELDSHFHELSIFTRAYKTPVIDLGLIFVSHCTKMHQNVTFSWTGVQYFPASPLTTPPTFVVAGTSPSPHPKWKPARYAPAYSDVRTVRL